LGNLIIRSRDGYSYTVHSLINILIDILNYLYRYTNLNINIRVELLEEVQIIWNNPAVVTDNLLV
jgi:hypothetical protein